MKILRQLLIPALVIFGIYIANTKLSKSVMLPIYGTVSNFALTDADGNPFDSSTLQGKVWTANFFFTSCGEICPLVTGKLNRIHKALLANSDFQLVSISIDPTHDTPSALTEFASRFGAKVSNWHFLTGEKSNIDNISLNMFKLGKWEDPTAHSERIVLIDKKGQIRGFYRGTEDDDIDNLKKAVNWLLVQGEEELQK